MDKIAEAMATLGWCIFWGLIFHGLLTRGGVSHDD
jgi:hypothetical protein